MQLGWIDFSKNERDKVLGVLDSLTEQGTLDELGIAPIRDGFADLFFPGTSTLQTRAKYFLLVPYACKDLERSDIANPDKAYKELYKTERETAQILHKSAPKESGIIGARYDDTGDWIKRPPSTLYWAGLRALGIYSGRGSLFEYLKAICALNRNKDTLQKLGNRNDSGEDCDDRDAGAEQSKHFFSVSTYNPKWKENLTIELTKEESDCLKEKIKLAAPGSLFACLLSSKDREFLNCDSFETLSVVVTDEKLKADCDMAVKFSEFVYVLRAVYNIVISNGENRQAAEETEKLSPHLKTYAEIDIEKIFLRLGIANGSLKRFLVESKNAMAESNTEKLKGLVTGRERSIKQGRAKTMNPSSAYADKWVGGKHLDYRWGNVKQLLKDIFDGETSIV